MINLRIRSIYNRSFDQRILFMSGLMQIADQKKIIISTMKFMLTN